MAELLTQEQASYIKVLAQLDYLRISTELKALRYDSRYTEEEKEVITKSLNDREKISLSIMNKNFKNPTHESTGNFQPQQEQG